MEKLLQEVLFVSTGIGEREEQLIHGGQVAAEICLCNEPKELKKKCHCIAPPDNIPIRSDKCHIHK
jgi:hypothetical protein